jgi:23S rRNA (cytidine1920-2'-O)/16S rRNA (cytidine1409-2'-O)-methyltransferase
MGSNEKKGKKRADVILVERGLAPSRERAQSLILTGNVLASDTPIAKPGQLLSEDTEIRIRGEDHPYVSRGGIKLASALDHFKIPVEGRVALDVGASTGGFTHVLLLRGASRVFAIDVGHNQLAWEIRNNPKVKAFEKINARYLEFDLIGEPVDLIVIDVSFISLEKILPPLLQFSKPGKTDWVTLIKPQFEVGKGKVGKGGIVTSEVERQAVLERVKTSGELLGLRQLGLIDSPITGTQGNQEYLAHWRQEKDASL